MLQVESIYCKGKKKMLTISQSLKTIWINNHHIKPKYLKRCGECKTGLSHTCTHGWQDEKALKSGVLLGLFFPHLTICTDVPIASFTLLPRCF